MDAIAIDEFYHVYKYILVSIKTYCNSSFIVYFVRINIIVFHLLNNIVTHS